MQPVTSICVAITCGILIASSYLIQAKCNARREFDVGYKDAAFKVADALRVTGGDRDAAITVVRDHAGAMLRYNEFPHFWKGVIAYLDFLERP